MANSSWGVWTAQKQWANTLENNWRQYPRQLFPNNFSWRQTCIRSVNDWQKCVGNCQPIKTRAIFTWFAWLHKMSDGGPSSLIHAQFETFWRLRHLLLNERVVRAKRGISIDIQFCADLYISLLLPLDLLEVLAYSSISSKKSSSSRQEPPEPQVSQASQVSKGPQVRKFIIHSKYFPVSDWLKPHAQFTITIAGAVHQIWKASSPYWINDVKSGAYRELLNHWRQKCSPPQIIKPLTEKTWGQGCVIFGERKN